MSFDQDPADDRIALDECIGEIRELQAANTALRARLEAAEALLRCVERGDDRVALANAIRAHLARYAGKD